jgi:phenylalanyl-tRNA synthetase beta chain
MLVSYNWLKDYLDFSEVTPAQLSEAFTLGGLEVENVMELGKDINGLVVGEVLTSEAIEDSDHLKNTTVDVGDEVLKIVCGAPNVAVGQKVAVAKVGTVLPGDFEIKETEIMGQPSHGMITSLDELGFPDAIIPKHAEDGIYDLEDDAVVGEDARPYIGLDDAIIEFDLTPNRADALSMRGVAHEAGAILNQKPAFEHPTVEENKAHTIEDYMRVEVEDAKDTPIYKMRIVEDVTIGESPMWMQHKLMHAGIRPIDLIVDITNYVMLEYGQPLHAFDYDKLESDYIYVRRANEGETIETLDGQTRELLDENLVITNGEKPVALAGVMGGANSQITDETQMIAIESAVFHPVLIRRTANRLNLRSEASSRYEKGINHATVQDAVDLAAQLMAELGGGTIISGTAEAEYIKPTEVKIETTVTKVNDLIGTTLTEKEVSDILSRLGFENSVKDDQITAYIPPRRWDITIPEDLIEEIARIYGYNKIPITLPVTESTPGELTIEQRIIRKIRRNLEGNGMQEAISYALTTTEKAEGFAIEDGKSASLKNPASEERVTLRRNLISGLIDNAKYNKAHQVNNITLYEVGHIFTKESEENFVENDHVAALLSGEAPADWLGETTTIDFYTIKGLVESLLDSFLFKEPIQYKLATDAANMHPGRTANVYIGDDLIGYVGQVHPKVAAANDLEETFVFELSIDKIVAAHKEAMTYEPLNRYPGSTRDIALLVDDTLSYSEISDLISENSGEWLQNIQLFDLYDGDNIEEGKKSIAFSLYYANPNATLKEEDVNKDFEHMKEVLINELDVEVR